MLTVTTVVENVFCKKFTYYSKVLGLPQYEEKRGMVLAGRKHHKNHEDNNKNFITSKLLGKKLLDTKLYSKKYNLVGIIDEAVEFSDEIVLIERKFTSSTKIHDTLKAQIGLLAILLEENLKKPVKKAILLFEYQGKRTKHELIVDKKIINFALNELKDTKQNIDSGILPNSNFDDRCLNCCYRRICPVGNLTEI